MSPRIRYLLWAFRRNLRPVNGAEQCPSCGGSRTRLLRRKYMVTALRECPNCSLRFRTPKDDPQSTEQFYIDEIYKQGLTTDLPSESELRKMLEVGFAGMETDFSRYVAILEAAGLPLGSRILDFGGSWGYGSWQLRQAGFEVFTYEIGRERARYAREKLACTVIDDLRLLEGKIDCFFSAHVIEHLPNPDILFAEAQRVLRPGGLLVCFCPNGSEERERRRGCHVYDLNWGLPHPLMLTPGFMKHAAEKRGFQSCHVFSHPVDLSDVRAQRDGKLDGDELLSLAIWRNL